MGFVFFFFVNLGRWIVQNVNVRVRRRDSCVIGATHHYRNESLLNSPEELLGDISVWQNSNSKIKTSPMWIPVIPVTERVLKAQVELVGRREIHEAFSMASAARSLAAFADYVNLEKMYTVNQIE